jgi:ubiquinone/menaquinone biosynthesis C-methylase UbiE
MTSDSEYNRKEFFSKVASEYDKYATERLGYEAHLKVPAKLLELHNKNEGTVLDLACGTGLGSLLFFESGFAVTGIDFSPGMIDVARSHPYKKLYCQSIEEELPVEDRSFDIVTAIGVWEFVKDPQRLLERIWEKLDDGGLCGITIPKHSEAENELEIRTYTPERFIQFIDKQRFEIVSEMDFYGWESGHLSELIGETGRPHHRIDYHALCLRKRKDENTGS